MNFKPVTPFVQKEFSKYESLRSIYMSEGHFLNQFLWENYYHTQYATDDTALYLYVKRDSAQGFFAPLCREEDLTEAFRRMEHYMEDKGKKAFDMIYEKIQEKDDFFVQDDKCVIRIEYKSKLISRDSTNVARTRKNINL